MQARQTGEPRSFLGRQVRGICGQLRETLLRDRVVWIDFKNAQKLCARAGGISCKQLTFGKLGQSLNQPETGVLPPQRIFFIAGSVGGRFRISGVSRLPVACLLCASPGLVGVLGTIFIGSGSRWLGSLGSG